MRLSIISSIYVGANCKCSHILTFQHHKNILKILELFIFISSFLHGSFPISLHTGPQKPFRWDFKNKKWFCGQMYFGDTDRIRKWWQNADMTHQLAV